MGDIISNKEKWDRWRERNEDSFKDFRNFINTNELIDIGLEEVPCTWCNNWDKEEEIKERLDRVLGFKIWLAKI